jgi:DNA-binding transcriptional ArsR family regulator
MDVHESAGDDARAAAIAAAIGEPARSRMLYRLMDGCARTATELALAAGVSPSTASAHLNRLKGTALVKETAQGKHRYYSLSGPRVARALEALGVLAGGVDGAFRPSTPAGLREARTCYDHIAGALGVELHDRLHAIGWLDDYAVTPDGTHGFVSLQIDLGGVSALRRRFACGCLDWSERRPHLAGALGAELLKLALERRWVARDLNSRALDITAAGRREMRRRFGAAV